MSKSIWFHPISIEDFKDSSINMDKHLDIEIVEIGDGNAGSGFIVIGTIILFHIDDNIYKNGRISLDQLQPLGRVAGNGYIRLTDTLEIIRKIKPDK